MFARNLIGDGFMARLILIALVMTLFPALVHAYDYENQRRLQARDSGELSLQEPKQKEIQDINQQNKLTKLKIEQRRKNRAQLRLNRKMGRGNYPGNITFTGDGKVNSFPKSKFSFPNQPSQFGYQ